MTGDEALARDLALANALGKLPPPPLPEGLAERIVSHALSTSAPGAVPADPTGAPHVAPAARAAWPARLRRYGPGAALAIAALAAVLVWQGARAPVADPTQRQQREIASAADAPPAQAEPSASAAPVAPPRAVAARKAAPAEAAHPQSAEDTSGALAEPGDAGPAEPKAPAPEASTPVSPVEDGAPQYAVIDPSAGDESDLPQPTGEAPTGFGISGGQGSQGPVMNGGASPPPRSAPRGMGGPHF